MITLESTKAAFESWRATRTNKATPIPTKLWGMVNHLLSSHKKSEIYKVFHLSSGQIKKHCIVAVDCTSAIANNQAMMKKSQILQSATNNGFVTAMPLPIVGNQATSELTLKGSSRSLHLRLPTSALCDVLPMLRELL